MQYLLDTNICVFFLRGQLNLNEIIREKGVENCFISELTIFELKFGAENSDNPKKSHEAVDKFINGLNIIPILGSVKEYAETKVYLRKNGTPMHDEFDLIIGVTALANELILVTDNEKDFRHIKNLKIENWFERK
ncbi:PIN domain-containing protein [Riemerella anatipestifer]|uniref:PIN domain-containing protein n=1 Tax=Riemerella anatipestifer TaxID=34085 RepID=UPI0007FFEBB7|nr:PIN domain-containing protein [Riemerella anatipestifer]MDY3364448.1 PIN domain-containing protein [Riemerella anatipestifer]MDY3521972.1 PIN domain-containing protein [Riemerella anatipestifer]MDY3534208.1 PIN domain-containing protein [Riemerella anatipestifer]MDY3536289.1 PIN domain-containing protein [Riemerella anatipestifer]OBP53359.1 DNA-binding protein [Riemerella anatipestifer]